MAWLRMLQLASPALPIGAYSYSQALEWAVATGEVCDQASAQRWIADVLDHCIARLDLPVCARLYAAREAAALQVWNDFYVASRDTAEFRAETLQMGYSLRKLLAEANMLDRAGLDSLNAIEDIAYPTAFTFAAARQEIPIEAALSAYAWAWLETQALAAMKLIPLGQVAGQTILHELAPLILGYVSRAQTLRDHELSNFAPGLAIASCKHETQYTRLFRS